MQQTSAKYSSIDHDHIWHPFTSLKASKPIPVERGEGIYLITPDGRKIIDAISSWWVNLHGHCHPHISKAIAEQANNLEHVIFAGFTHEPAVKLISRLKEHFPSKIEKFFFSDDGSTSVEVGLKMAIQYWYNKGDKKKTKIIAWEDAYHGDTFGAMSAGGESPFNNPFRPFLFDVHHLPFPNGNNHDAIIEEFTNYVKSGEVASFIFEPLIQGAAGMRTYSADLLDKLIEIAHQHEVICHADEVFTGFGRTGRMFATDYLKNKPDIISISKGLTGGYLPMSITACSGMLAEAFSTGEKLKTFYHGHSYTANTLACAAANASLDLLLADECQEHIKMISQSHKEFLAKIKGHPTLEDARMLGTILALELKTSEDSSYFNNLRDKIYEHFLSRDILLRPLGNVIYLVPPYVITKEQLLNIYKEIERFLD